MDNIKEIEAHNFESTFKNMLTFQRVHNELRKDFLSIYELARDTENLQIAKPLIRASFKEMFSLIEADIYLLNQFNPYIDYDDRADFARKFKKTFRHHARTFNKQEINVKFNSHHFKHLLVQKKKRDDVTHPKGRESIDVQQIDLENIYELYENYTSLINESMANVYISPKFRR